MNNRLIEENLDSVRRRWKWLEFGRWVGTVGSAFCLVWFVIQLAAWNDFLSSAWIYHFLAFIMILAALGALLVIYLIMEARRTKRSWMANVLEKSCRPLLDRVNTLVYLEENPRLIRSFRLKQKIEEQATKVFQTTAPSPPFSSKRTWNHLGMFLLLLVGIIFFQEWYEPFNKLLTDSPAPAPKSAPFELAPQSSVTETEPVKVWGEVRIVDPGHDVKLTKIDVLPLQIEMTTSAPMTSPAWVTSVDGGEESVHDLEPPRDPNYMVYQPLIYLDQLKVTEWDVVSYYAKVQSTAPAEYASPLNFIEIRPFREDILKLTGGKDGKNDRYQLLSELTGLIKQQTDLLQQTHQHAGTTYPQDDMRLQDAKKLSQGEAELATATNHFFGEIAAKSENTPVGEILDELSLAEKEMDRATQALQDDVSNEAKQREQGALTHLIACRKAFQKTISDHPDAFGGNQSDATADEPPVTATESLKALSQVSEMHDHDQEALQSLHQLTARQQSLAQKPIVDPQLTQHDQMQVKSDLHDLINQNPDLFRGSDQETATVEKNILQSVVNLDTGHKDEAKHSMSRTADSMKDLEGAVNKNHEGRQLEEAYKLKSIIEQNAHQLAQEQAQPGSLSDQQVKDLTNSAQHSTRTLKDIVDNDKSGSFGPKLSQALSAENQQTLNNALNRFDQSPAGPGRGAAAGEAQIALQGIGHAFEQSQPDLTNRIRGQDELQPQQGGALDQAAQQLQSMILAAEGEHPNSPGDQAKALDQMLYNLKMGLTDSKLDKAASAKVAADADLLEKSKISGSPVDPAALKKLLSEIESVRIEANDPNHPKPPELDTTQIDPSKFPPAYRERLRTYFEQLSNQNP